MNTLFDGYNELIRPVKNMSELVKVDFQLALHQLILVVRTIILTMPSFDKKLSQLSKSVTEFLEKFKVTVKMKDKINIKRNK